MRKVELRQKWTIIGMAAAAVVLWMAMAAGSMKAQTPAMRGYRVGPVLVGDGQTLRIDYSNIFGARPVRIRIAFFSAANGALVGGLKDATVPSGTSDDGGYTNTTGSPTLVVGVAWLAEPRPDPLLQPIGLF